MSKRHNQDQSRSGKPPEFLAFWLIIAAEIGAHRLSINAQAKRLKELFNATAVHPDFLKKIILDSLKNKSGSLKQSIDLNHVLDLLGEAAYQLRNNGLDDLYDIEMLEEIAWHINARFPHLIATQNPASKTAQKAAKSPSKAAKKSAIILSMKKHCARKQR